MPDDEKDPGKPRKRLGIPYDFRKAHQATGEIPAVEPERPATVPPQVVRVGLDPQLLLARAPDPLDTQGSLTARSP